ncbi:MULTISPECIES: hypothetical protein [unclassified Moorena]|nr:MULTISPECIES: hypothetical protein [unclassified Moorena]
MRVWQFPQQSCPFAHPTRSKLLNSQFSILNSRFPIPDSRFPMTF